MIEDIWHAMQVQTRRRESGKKGRSKAVRRWAKRDLNCAIDIYTGGFLHGHREALSGNFKGCRGHEETHREK